MTAAAEPGPPVAVDEQQIVHGATGNLAALVDGSRNERGPAGGSLGARLRRVDRAAVMAVLLVGSAAAARKVGGWAVAAALAVAVAAVGAEAVMAWRRTTEVVTTVVAALLVGCAAAAPWLANPRWLIPTGDPCQRAVIQVCDQGPGPLSASWRSR